MSACSSFARGSTAALTARALPARPARGALLVRAGPKSANGPFTPLVRATRAAMGDKEFNTFRGKAISLHSQVRV